MKEFELVKVEPGDVVVSITLLDGKTITEKIGEYGDVEGLTELGSFSLKVGLIESVEFQR